MPFRFGLEAFRRVTDCEDYTAGVHKRNMPNPHYYLWILAVDPAHQRRGIGKSLMTHGLEMARQTGKPVYLETHDPNNIPYYERLGFDVIGEETIPKHNVRFWSFSKAA